MVSLIAPAVNRNSIYTNQLRRPEVSNADSQAVSGKFLLLLQTFAGQVTRNPFICNRVLPPLYHCQGGTLRWKIGRAGGTNPSQWCLIK